MDVPTGVTQEEGNTGFSTHLLSAVLALIFLARRITRRTTHELTQLYCITHVSGSTTTQLCCITHPSGKYYHSVVLYNSPEWKVLPLSYVV